MGLSDDLAAVFDRFRGEVLALVTPSSPPVDPPPVDPDPVPDPIPDPPPVDPGPVDPPPVDPPTDLPPPPTRPGPDNTGVPAGLTLKASGSVSTSKAGQVIEGLDIAGVINVTHPGTIVRNCRVTSSSGSFWSLRVSGDGSVTIEDTELTGGKNGIQGGNWTARRVNIHRTLQDGVKLGSNSTLVDSWVHTLTPEAGAHADGMQCEGSGKNITVRNCVVDVASPADGVFGNSAVILKNDLGGQPSGPVLIEDCYLNGGNYTVFAVPGSSGQLINDVTIRRNTFGATHRYGVKSIKMPVTWENNTDTIGNPV
jgi:hypothetical protein